jgi:hypothetical protein
MTQNKKLIDEMIDYIESSVHEDFTEGDFIKQFRDKIENYIKERVK